MKLPNPGNSTALPSLVGERHAKSFRSKNYFVRIIRTSQWVTLRPRASLLIAVAAVKVPPRSSGNQKIIKISGWPTHPRFGTSASKLVVMKQLSLVSIDSSYCNVLKARHSFP